MGLRSSDREVTLSSLGRLPAARPSDLGAEVSSWLRLPQALEGGERLLVLRPRVLLGSVTALVCGGTPILGLEHPP